MSGPGRSTRAPAPGPAVPPPPGAPVAAVALSLSIKLVLFGMLLYAAAHRDVEALAGRTTTARIVVYPLVALAVPVAWWFARAFAERRFRYPAVLDSLVTLPPALDLGATILTLPGRFGWWEEAAHFAYWALLAGAAGALALALRVGPLVGAGLALGFGAATAIVWEVGQYAALHRGEAIAPAEYTETVRDLALSLAASAVAAAVVAAVGRRRATRA